MDIILHNYIADMPGPDFLGFYTLAIVITLILCWILKYVADRSRFLPSLLIPTQPDPYELAYLRNGEWEVARVVVFNLIQQTFLEIVQNQADEQQVQQAATDTSFADQLSPMERRVFDWFAQPRTSWEVSSSELPILLKPFCATYQQNLEEERLLTSSVIKNPALLILLPGVLIIAGLGGYKLFVATMKGYSNVGFLMTIGLVALVLLYFVGKTPRLSARGRKYLRQLERVFGSLKERVTKGTTVNSDMTDSANSYLLTIGLFGTSMLANTPYADCYQILHPAIARGGGYSGGGNYIGGGYVGGGCGGGGGGGGCGGCGGGGGGH